VFLGYVTTRGLTILTAGLTKKGVFGICYDKRFDNFDSRFDKQLAWEKWVGWGKRILGGKRVLHETRVVA